jgi:hypothetical protein
MSPFQPTMIRAAIERLVSGAAVWIATDNNAEDIGFAWIIECLVVETGRGTWWLNGPLPPAPRIGTTGCGDSQGADAHDTS